jgi:hypothetical protein
VSKQFTERGADFVEFGDQKGLRARHGGVDLILRQDNATLVVVLTQIAEWPDDGGILREFIVLPLKQRVIAPSGRPKAWKLRRLECPLRRDRARNVECCDKVNMY